MVHDEDILAVAFDSFDGKGFAGVERAEEGVVVAEFSDGVGGVAVVSEGSAAAEGLAG